MTSPLPSLFVMVHITLGKTRIAVSDEIQHHYRVPKERKCRW